MNIQLTLKRYCIQTAAKKKYERSISLYFKQKSPSDHPKRIHFEKEIENLKFFLENADFGQIRSNYVELNGKKKIDAILIISDQPDKWQLNFCNQLVFVLWKKKQCVSSEKIDSNNNSSTNQ
ncbi:hypothetical protein MHK_001204 [Candidatus Magnetomorum sp. HK-1]|nr:hypothetical protein MHK_001204 [Candidatus Magnetomorum sp. HK-1]